MGTQFIKVLIVFIINMDRTEFKVLRFTYHTCVYRTTVIYVEMTVLSFENFVGVYFRHTIVFLTLIFRGAINNLE